VIGAFQLHYTFESVPQLLFQTTMKELHTSILKRLQLTVYLRGLNNITSTAECSSLNLSHVSFVRKCTLPGSLLQSGGGGGGPGFWGLEHRLTETNLRQSIVSMSLGV